MLESRFDIFNEPLNVPCATKYTGADKSEYRAYNKNRITLLEPRDEESKWLCYIVRQSKRLIKFNCYIRIFRIIIQTHITLYGKIQTSKEYVPMQQ